MPLVRDRCVCVRKIEYSETSQILSLFSRENGLIRLIAKGAHRRTRTGSSKFDGGIDLLDLGDAVFSHAPERDLCPLTEWHLIDGHLELRRNLRAMYLGLYAAELVSMLIEEHDAHPELFDRLEQTLTALATPQVEEVFLNYEVDLLRETGYMPQLQECGICSGSLDRSQRAYFSPARGAVICRNCEMSTPDRIEIHIRLLRLLSGLQNLDRSNGSIDRLPRLTRHQTDPLNQLIAAHLQHTLSRRLRMTQHVLRK